MKNPPVLISDRIVRSAIGSKLAYSATTLSEACNGGRRAEGRCIWPSFGLLVPVEGDDIDRIGCIADVDGGSKGGPRAVVWRSGRRSKVVAFRGTIGFRDVADSLDVRTARYSSCGSQVRVHSGMLRAFSEMEAALTSRIVGSTPCKDGLPLSLTFTGHSKGGCHAQFAAAYYGSMLAGSCRVACHTFGAPRAGDGAFADWYSETVEDSVVMVDRDDPVARLPPECAGYHGDTALAGTLFVRRKRNPFFSLESHDMDSYLEHALGLMISPASLPGGSGLT